MTSARTAFDWLFRNRQTGGITIGQFPNPPLWIWLAATGLGMLLDWLQRPVWILSWIATAALVWWAGDEVLRGVNPFRRMLGTVVLGWIAWGLLHR